MKIRRLWMAAVSAFAAAAILSGCGAEQGRTLRVGVKDDVANFGLYDEESGRYSGMEIDLAQQLCDDLGYSNLELTTVTTATREQYIDDGDLDMVIATYSATEERRENYDLSTPYYVDHVMIMVEESSMISNLKDLKDCRVGAMKNSTNMLSLAEYMAQKKVIPEFDRADFSAETFDGGITFVEYDSYSEVSRALEYGEVDAFVADRSILGGYISDDRVVLPDEFSEQDYSVCTKKGSSLSAKVDEAIQKRLADGTITQLVNKWGN